MKCLFLDLASHDALIACIEGGGIPSFASVHARISDKDLVSMAEKVLADAGWAYRDLTQLACVVGPGGFTSLRVAVTFGNTLEDQLGIPAAGIHQSDLYAARAWGSERRAWDACYWLHSTKKDQLFIRGGRWKEPALIFGNELPPSPFPWMGECIDAHRNIVGNDSVALRPTLDVLPEFLAGLQYTSAPLRPWYGRGWL